MEQKPVNPLSKHFRQPATYFKLPSQGRFWAAGTLELPVTGEIPVYPMTARDEITLRTPDALLNGQGVVDVIQSCCPNIKNAWAMPSIDVDAVLLNIRIASYGNSMDFDTKCPACGEESSFALDVSGLISQLQAPDYDTALSVEGLQIKLQPQPYIEINKASQIQFTEQQILRTVNDSNITDEEKKQKTDDYLKKLINLNVAICAKSTREIITEEGVSVSDAAFIEEFYNEASYKILKEVQARLGVIAEAVGIKPVAVTCDQESCQNKYEVPLNFDYANFFA
jgi:hypothetical protein